MPGKPRSYKKISMTLMPLIISENLKNTNIKAVFKKGDRNNERNYRPVGILPNVSKTYEKCLYK